MNKDDAIAYLLNELPEAERAAFAERWFVDSELYEQLRMAEAMLLDEYARGRLSRKRRRQVEQFLLGSEVQRRKLEFAGALRAAIPGAQRVRVRWAYLAAALLLATTGLSVWLDLENRGLQREVARLEAGVHGDSRSIYAFSIPSDTLRGESVGISVRVPQGVRLLRLELEMKPGDEASTYLVSIFGGGKQVWSEGPLRPEVQGASAVAVVWIPAVALSQGDYTVQLTASGNPIANYRFTVTR